MTMYKALIFDLDGTLLNTSRDICKVLNDALRTFGCPEVTLERTLRCVGDGARKLIERVVPEHFDRFEELYEYYRVKFANDDNSLTTRYEGEDEFFARIGALGIKTAILSNKPDDAAQRVCRHLLSDYSFDVIMGQTEGFNLKPDPASTLHIIGKLGVLPEQCLFVGDGEPDIATAANAGIDCASVLWGFRSRSQLEAAGGRLFVSSFAELGDVVTGGGR